MQNIGRHFAVNVELWGILLGTRLAWSLGAHHLSLDSDSMNVFELLR